MHLSLRNYITAAAVFLALTAANLLAWHNPAVGLVIALDILLHGLALGALALPGLSYGWRLAFGLMAVGAFKIVSETVAYYLIGLGSGPLLIIAALPLFIIGAWWSRAPEAIPLLPGRDVIFRHPDVPAAVLGLAVVFLDLSAFRLLDLSRTTDAIRSPWELVPWQFLLLFGVAGAGLFALAITNRGRRLILPLSFLHVFIGLSVALTVYRMGFGFDPFIHQAAESAIVRDGVILPKTLYYIGQYVQVAGTSRITSFPVDLVDRPLVPVMASLIIPALLCALSRLWKRKEKHDDAPLAPFALLLPVPMFVLTTPQGNGNLWLLATAVAAALGSLPLWMVWLFALAAAAMHPIAGVPALAIAAFKSITAIKKASWLPGFLASLLFALAIAALPLAFWLNAERGGALDVEVVRPTFGALFRLLPFPSITIPDHFDLPLDLAYLLRWNIPAVVLALAAYGLWNLTHRARARSLTPHVMTAAALGVSYLVIRGFFRFPGVIAYEETIFPHRLLEVAVIALVPAAAAGMLALLDKAPAPPLRVAAVLLLSGMTVSSVYLSYPRVDRYEKSSGQSLSASMTHAVMFLEENARDPYIVLADQNAAAAQIRSYGFGPYFHGSYFYAHPSGGLALYRFYQRMVEEGPSREIALEAMDFAGTEKAYFIIHDYWKNFRRIVDRAQKSADDWVEIDGGKVYLFRYTRSGSPGLRTSAEIF